ncbi:MAG: hypothetical protein QXQ53_05280, partial [Candidatus Methanosuratincola sp.]
SLYAANREYRDRLIHLLKVEAIHVLQDHHGTPSAIALQQAYKKGIVQNSILSRKVIYRSTPIIN